MNRRRGRWRSSRFNVTRKTRLPSQHRHPGAMRTTWSEGVDTSGVLDAAMPSRMTALSRRAGEAAGKAAPAEDDDDGLDSTPAGAPGRCGSGRAGKGGGGCAGKSASKAAMACSRALAEAPVTSVVATLALGDDTALHCPFLASLPGSTPSCLSLRYRWVRSRPVFSATRVMLPPSRPRWCSKYMRSKASRASRSGRSKDRV